MTLLTIVQDACDEIGVPAPSTVIGNNDRRIKQMLALSNRSGKMLAQRFPFQELILEATHTTVAAELQGAVETIMPGFNWYLYETMWNRSSIDRVNGPLFPHEWQGLKATGITGPYPEFRIRGKNLYMLPTPTAGQTIGLEYAGRYWCESSGGTDQARWAADTDVGILSEDLLTLDLIWRYLKKKGLDYAEEMRDTEVAINNDMARSGARRILNMSDCPDPNKPYSITVPEGSWNIS